MNTQKNNLMAAASRRKDASGRVRFDDRGNAIWETEHARRLEHPSLTLVDEELPTPGGGAPLNLKGGRVGYDPYQSGIIRKSREHRPRKKDLRALSHWIQMRKKLEPKP